MHWRNLLFLPWFHLVHVHCVRALRLVLSEPKESELGGACADIRVCRKLERQTALRNVSSLERGKNTLKYCSRCKTFTGGAVQRPCPFSNGTECGPGDEAAQTCHCFLSHRRLPGQPKVSARRADLSVCKRRNAQQAQRARGGLDVL